MDEGINKTEIASEVKLETQVIKKNAETHLCKYCGCETTQPDNECYKRPVVIWGEPLRNRCSNPDWDESYSDGKHKYGKDGYCIFCGDKQ